VCLQSLVTNVRPLYMFVHSDVITCFGKLGARCWGVLSCITVLPSLIKVSLLVQQLKRGTHKECVAFRNLLPPNFFFTKGCMLKV
jgi:hypothetical protein